MNTRLVILLGALLLVGFGTWRNYMALQLIKGFEKLSLVPYKDSGGVWTIGWGHKIVPGDPYEPYGPEKQITSVQADQLLQRDASMAISAVDNAVKVPLNTTQREALISLAYNIGSTAFHNSTLVKKLNNFDYAGAAQEFPKWSHDNGVLVEGLLNRRLLEQQVFTA